MFSCLFFLLLLFPLQTTAAPASTQDEEEIIVLPVHQENKNTYRAPAFIPIEASFSRIAQRINIHFLDNLGTVNIILTSLVNQTQAVFTVPSSAGTAHIPLSLPEGYCTISFRTETGITYFGQFIITSE